jgi:hypothetical protein
MPTFFSTYFFIFSHPSLAKFLNYCFYVFSKKNCIALISLFFFSLYFGLHNSNLPKGLIPFVFIYLLNINISFISHDAHFPINLCLIWCYHFFFLLILDTWGYQYCINLGSRRVNFIISKVDIKGMIEY